MTKKMKHRKLASRRGAPLKSSNRRSRRVASAQASEPTQIEIDILEPVAIEATIIEMLQEPMQGIFVYSQVEMEDATVPDAETEDEDIGRRLTESAMAG
jgi:hypothetical protein